MTTTHTLDANKKTLGRVSSQAANLLMGKNLPTFSRSSAPDVHVIIKNAGKLAVTEKKRDEKTYRTHSHFVGGEHYSTLAQVIAKKGMSEVIRKAVYGMLPYNRLRAVMMKHLTIEE